MEPPDLSRFTAKFRPANWSDPEVIQTRLRPPSPISAEDLYLASAMKKQPDREDPTIDFVGFRKVVFRTFFETAKISPGKVRLWSVEPAECSESFPNSSVAMGY
jgi:hypothetical protein